MEVENSGELTDNRSTDTQVGLNNIRERLRILYGDRASLTLRNGSDNRVVATIQIPNAHEALIVDDERLARVELRRLLAQHPEIEIAGEASNGEEALALAAQLSPDLLFLDIQMPGSAGSIFW
jgi:PleD family two-component response regulator